MVGFVRLQREGGLYLKSSLPMVMDGVTSVVMVVEIKV